MYGFIPSFPTFRATQKFKSSSKFLSKLLHQVIQFVTLLSPIVGGRLAIERVTNHHPKEDATAELPGWLCVVMCCDDGTSRKITYYKFLNYIPSPLHPGKLTWNLKLIPSQRKLIFNTVIFGFHVIFRGCISLLFLCPKNHGISKLVVWRSQTPAFCTSKPLLFGGSNDS